MGTYYGVNATKNLTPSPQNSLDPSEQGGRVRWIHDSYEAAAVSGTIVMGGKVPQGAQILPFSKLYHDAMGSITIAVGTTVGGTELSAAEDVSSAGDVELGNDVDSFGTKLSSAANIYLTTNGAATGTLRLSLAYSMA